MLNLKGILHKVSKKKVIDILFFEGIEVITEVRVTEILLYINMQSGDIYRQANQLLQHLTVGSTTFQ